MNGHRFHQQKRIEMRTEQCERSLKLMNITTLSDYEQFEYYESFIFSILSIKSSTLIGPSSVRQNFE